MRMKRFFLFVVFVLLLSGCEKNRSMGLYSAKTPDGVLYLELLDDSDCVMYFKDGKEVEGYYTIAKGEIDLIAHAACDDGPYTVTWWFGGTLGHGLISSSSIYIQGMRTELTQMDYRFLSFRKIQAL